MLLGCYIELVIVVDSKYLFTSLSTQKNSINRSNRADVNVIHFEFETGSVDEMVWTPGSVNLADPSTKRDNQLNDTLQLTLYNRPFAIDLCKQKNDDAIVYLAECDYHS